MDMAKAKGITVWDEAQFVKVAAATAQSSDSKTRAILAADDKVILLVQMSRRLLPPTRESCLRRGAEVLPPRRKMP
jgi:hypothetical protein